MDVIWSFPRSPDRSSVKVAPPLPPHLGEIAGSGCPGQRARRSTGHNGGVERQCWPLTEHMAPISPPSTLGSRPLDGKPLDGPGKPARSGGEGQLRPHRRTMASVGLVPALGAIARQPWVSKQPAPTAVSGTTAVCCSVLT